MERHKHRWDVRGVVKEKRSPTGLIYLPPLYRVCHLCKEEDRETVLCEAVKSGGDSRWPIYSTCGNPAKVTIEGRRATMLESDDFVRTRHYCGLHNPVIKAARDAEGRRKRDEDWRAKNAAWARQGRASRSLPYVDELLEWANENDDLVQSDEWLGRIVRNLREEI